MKSDKQNKKSIFPVIMGIIWGFLIVNSIFLVLSIYDYDDRFYAKAGDIASNITSEEFAQLSTSVGLQLNNGMTLEEEPEYTELVAIRNYFDSASQYHMYTEDNQTDKAQYYYNKMQESKKDLGRFDYLADKINRRFDIE